MKAIVFPGQGAQYPQMGKDLYDNFPQARKVFTCIDDLLGLKISQVCFKGTVEDLKSPHSQQLAILAVSLAAYEVFKEKNIEVDFLSGLSLGEYTCLYPAGVLGIENLVYLIKARADATEEAAKHCSSAMFAVFGLEREQLKEKGKEKGFYLANINSSNQMVISLKEEDKEEIKNALSNCGARVVELEVSGGFHSPFMKPAKKQFKKVVDKLEFKPAKIPVVSNVTAEAHTDKEEIKTNIIEQLTSPVLWRNCVESMIKKGVRTFFEIGPSRILRGLIKSINLEVKVTNIGKEEDFNKLNGL